MPDCTLDSSVPEWVIEHPETLKVFEELGIDASCGGKSLEYACQERGWNPHFVLKRLAAAIPER